MVFSGNTASSSESTASNNASNIISFSITDKSGGGATASVAVYFGSTVAYILYEEDIASGTSFIYHGGRIVVPAGYKIMVTTSAAISFYFTIE